MELYQDGVVVRQVNKGKRRWYEVDGDEDVVGVELRNVSSVLNIINKPALIPWAKKDALERVVRAGQEIDSSHIDFDNSHSDLDKLRLVVSWKDIAEELVSKARTLQTGGEIAADKGTEMHEMLSNLLSPFSVAGDTTDLEMLGVGTTVIDYLIHEGLEVLYTEAPVYSRLHKYGGTCDLIVYNSKEDRAEVIDFKSGRIYDESSLQVTAYAYALMETSNVPMNRIMGARVLSINPSNPGKLDIKIVDNIQEHHAGFHAALALDNWQKKISKWRGE